MLVIYDLDKTSLYCPLADLADRFIPKNKFLKQLYYNIYPFIHTLEMKLGLFQINTNMYVRAKQYDEIPGVVQVIITARHFSSSVRKHVEAVFKDLDISAICIAQGLSNINKVDIVQELPIGDKEEIVMYDDSWTELLKMKAKFKKRFTGIRVLFKDNKEKIETYVR